MNPSPYLDGGEQEYERDTERERDTHTQGGGEKGMVFAFVSVMGQFFCHSTSKRGCNRSFGQAPIVLELPNCSLL
jgi:hypothetical protein